ncbi:MAG: hypothetical protein HOB84_06350 [Candidatus Marinimicrobia bacterium]|nr:hypothetical protein [Candidatus Neomarinimicrobiota bacterium]MBT4361195.1 hypothetical protein [Candidatus Neomarinimicrobiota bacterium]MBT4714371.1 hypothetical protein [Candidatus Neomarinimicrobiota bacterium]MBT4945304.1 hypothetical protein [Candidatus Neomarinimicrobiota bacterium]MBT6010556.1 hypothetical protein [Candidatus Neomarinimicrobiota bacterium]
MRESYHGIEYEGESFLTIEQIAMMLRTWPFEINVYIENGELKSQVIDKSTMISEANLEAFLETHSFPARWIGGDGY